MKSNTWWDVCVSIREGRVVVCSSVFKYKTITYKGEHPFNNYVVQQSTSWTSFIVTCARLDGLTFQIPPKMSGFPTRQTGFEIEFNNWNLESPPPKGGSPMSAAIDLLQHFLLFNFSQFWGHYLGQGCFLVFWPIFVLEEARTSFAKKIHKYTFKCFRLSWMNTLSFCTEDFSYYSILFWLEYENT